ncbi:MAG TPA: M48 family metallopeptidase [Patescibacteria group bacterium]|nr:M48 family metallopeptidase [Patescibacteria group bacterium]
MPERINFDDQISRNKWKTFFLIFVIFSVIILLGYVISYAFDPSYFYTIMIFAFIFSIIYILISYYNSDKIALASVGAKEAKREEYRQYYDIVEGLTIASGLPMPKLYIMNSEQINAFASGRNPQHSVVCVTNGALKKLDKNELEGVIAHELGHIASYDIRYMTLVAVMVGMTALISQIFLRTMQFGGRSNDRENKGNAIFILIGVLLAIIAPIVVYFVQLAISRKREYSADASSVKFTRYPQGLIRALKKIDEENKPEKKINKAVAPLFIANPFNELGSTHPPIKKRIEVLERM